jgi:adenylate cyclase 1
LLGEERFRAIDKIKTVGSTYMAAVGLIPELRILDDDNDATAGFYLGTLVEFVFAMRDKLLNINENSYNNFMLRVGEFIRLLIKTKQDSRIDLFKASTLVTWLPE